MALENKTKPAPPKKKTKQKKGTSHEMNGNDAQFKLQNPV